MVIRKRPVIQILLIMVCSIGPAAALQAQDKLTLQQALHTARSNNPFLKPERLNTSLAQSDLVTAGLRPNPVLNNQTLQLMQDQYFAEGTKALHPKNRQVWWQLTKQFQLSGQRRYKMEVAQRNITLTEKNYSNAERNVLFAAGNKWLDVWYNKVNLNLVQDAKANIDSLVRTQEVRLKNQVISTTELARTQLLSEQYQLQLNNARQNYKNEIRNLQLLLGNADSVGIDVNDPVISLELVQEMDSLMHVSFNQRPDMQAARSSVEMAESNIKLQRSLSRPVPELGVVYNPQNTVRYMGFFGTIDLPLFSRNQGEIRKSKVTLQQSRETLSALQQQVQTEVQTAYGSYQLNRQTVEKYREILSKAEQVLQSVRYAYVKGGTTIIDFLDAQRTWFDTRKMYYDALYSYRKSYIELLFVTGLINQL